jgi:medium-chain acyl-[acyl-carrier-protein] hydrolase
MKLNNSWLQLSQIPSDAEWSLICFPFAGGYAEYFLPWHKQLEKCALYPVQLPGRSYRWQEGVLTQIDELLDALVSVLLPVIRERPYVLFGHSMGGYIAYSFAKRIKALAEKDPTCMIVSSVPAPEHWLARKNLSELSEAEFEVFFKKLGGFHPELLKHESFIKLQMSLLRQDIMLCESCGYEGQAEFGFPIVALGSTQDEYVSFESMVGWGKETQHTFVNKQMEGDHFYLNQNLDKIFSLISSF